MRTIAGLLLTTMLTLSAGCARTDWIDRTLVTVDVTGVWSGSTTAQQPGQSYVSNFLVRLELQQQGARVSGYLRVSPALSTITSGPIEGTVAGDVLRFKDKRGELSGELTISGDDMAGPISSTRQLVINLRRVDPALPPVSPTR